MILRFTSPWRGKRIYTSFNTKFESWNCANTAEDGRRYIAISQKAMKEILLNLDFYCFAFSADLYNPPKIEQPAEDDTDDIPEF